MIHTSETNTQAELKAAWQRPVVSYIDIKRTCSAGGSTIDLKAVAGTSAFQS